MDESPEEPQYPQWLPALFPALSFLVFLPALWNAYAFDSVFLLDRLVDEETTFLQLFDPQTYGPNTGVMSWRPLGSAVHLVYDIWIGGARPAVSHALNLLLHGTNAWFLFLLLWRLFTWAQVARPLFPVLGGSLLFLVHPLVSEVVLCAGFRFDILALFFVLLALLAVRPDPPPQETAALGDMPMIAMVAACTAAALLSKEIGVVAVALAPVLLWVYRGRPGPPAVLAVVLVAVLGGFLMIWSKFRFVGYPTEFLGGEGRLLGMVNFLVSANEVYLRKLILPWPLRVDYAFQPVESLTDLRAVVGIGFLLLTLAVVAPLLRASVLARMGLFWVLVAFGPISQLIPVPDPVGERFAYVPMAGLALLAAAAARLALERAPRPGLLLGLGLGLLVALGALSHLRALQWEDDLALNVANWEAAPLDDPRTMQYLGALYQSRAQQRLSRGEEQAARQDIQAAFAQLERLVALQPDNAEAHRLLAVWHANQDRIEESRHHLDRALDLAPNDPRVKASAQVLGQLLGED